MKKVKSTTLKRAVEKFATVAGKSLPCGTSIKFSREKSSLTLMCAPNNRSLVHDGVSNDAFLNVPDLCCQAGPAAQYSVRALQAQAGASSCGQQGFPISAMCPYTSGTVVW